jgi:hypothetical protein
LQNLLRINRLAEHETDSEQFGKLLSAADRFLNDAGQETVSLETRLAAAYCAITQYSMLALWGNGYRPSRSTPGHHQTMIQSLVHSIDLDRDLMLLLDTFRVKRNAIDYTGDDVDEGSVLACITAAEQLRVRVMDWVSSNAPELIA